MQDELKLIKVLCSRKEAIQFSFALSNSATGQIGMSWLWFWGNDTMNLITSFDPIYHSAPSVLFNDCFIALHATIGIPLNAQLTDSGDIAFTSRLVDPVTGSLFNRDCSETPIRYYKYGT